MVELGFTTVSHRATYHIGRVWGDTRDERGGIISAPGGSGRLDRVQIGNQIGALTYALPNPLGRSVFVTLPVEVGGEELPVGGDHITAQAGFLVPHCRLQLARRQPRRLNVIAQIARNVVGVDQQHGGDRRTGEYHHSHDGQHESQPPAHGEPRFERQLGQRCRYRVHVVVRSTRKTAMSSVRPPRG